jgi:hypothetical protein
LSAHLADLPAQTPIEIWFQDEARIGQKNGLVRQWARRGSRHASLPTSAMKALVSLALSVRRGEEARRSLSRWSFIITVGIRLSGPPHR